MNVYKHIVLAAISSLVIYGCKNEKTTAVKSEKKAYCLNKDTKSKLTFYNVATSPVTQSIPLTGVVEANPDKVIPFISLVGGIVSKTNFSLGDKVIKGQILAELRSTELSALKAELNNIESQITVAKKNLASVASMYNDGISSEKELLEVKSELNILNADKDKVAANLNLFSASSEKGVFQIKSPTTGFVTQKSITAGSQISAEGDPLFTISDLSDVWVMVNVYASNIQNIEVGMDTEIKTLSYPDEIFKAKIAAISQVFDVDAKVLKARVVIENDNLKLKPGMLVDVTALKEVKLNTLCIPESALVFDNSQHYVVVYKEDCFIENRVVQVLTTGHGKAFISSGLTLNEKIISKNQILVYDQIKNTQKK
ncbi:efflux RND transporter periplasmic adaptor subunit [Wenyingzhuangia sp. chi5]|uniref:Efflux RND transporter periplasmic adaptor subunit n=1 Tax=Wenyingzhuangia gilva TaxID=3057677 RepID=A0ABT8VUC2_9FLAO|nr:efflux RND transporter periplasmic adaptor subunit [Wenyingzhuangia sp. chi5]MDO3695537.1 efflux RND transporter periplasmic adaptor subunit [Wenyingzhuangia sp. chi5]